MAHSPEKVEEFVCTNCHVTHAGTPVHESPANHNFEAPESCGACGETEFIRTENWVHFHE